MKLLILGLIVSFICSLLIVKYHHLYADYTNTLHDGPQKIHNSSVPRIGGLSIFLSLTISTLYVIFQNPQHYYIASSIFISSAIVFFVGFLEDITNKVSIKNRLIFVGIGAIFATKTLNILITNIDIPYINQALNFLIIAWPFTIIAIVGLTNAYNIIDGLNGLASMVGIISLSAITYISLKLGDFTIMTMSLMLIGAILGFFLWNYPSGAIFLGDGGAYLIGFNVALLSISLINRHHEISPWFGLLINAYPIFETLFTIWRRRIRKGRNPGTPDRSHIHSILFRRNVRTPRRHKKFFISNRNSQTSIYLWGLCGLATIPAVLWWNNTLVLAFFFVLFCISYILIYRFIILLNKSSWHL